MEKTKVRRARMTDISNFQIGDQILVPTTEWTSYKATAQFVDQNGAAFFLFDECVDVRPMNAKPKKKKDFLDSDLYFWLNDDFKKKIPEWFQDRMFLFSIPSIEQMFGTECEVRSLFSRTNEVPWNLMANPVNRLAPFEGKVVRPWLRNIANKKQGDGETQFATVKLDGTCGCAEEQKLRGVRPCFWIIR